MVRTVTFCALALLPVLIAAEARSVWEGIYTKQQAANGLKIYAEECARCHGDNLLGGESTPGLVGDEFLDRWNGKSVADLYNVTRDTMPTDGPASLSRRQYADLVAYMLSVNQFPAGEQELGSEAEILKQIRIEKKK